MKPSQIYNKKLKESKLEQIKKIGDAEYFDDRFGGIVTFLQYVILPILVLWCALTGGAFVGLNIYQLTQSGLAALMIAALFVVFLEASQLKIGKKIIDAVCFGWWKEGWHYAAIISVLVIFFLAAFGGSIYLSVKGSPIASSYIADLVCPPTLSNTDSISSTYKAALLSQDSKTSTALGIRTEKGLVAWKGQKIAELSERNKGKLLDLQHAELSAVIARDSTGYAHFEAFKMTWGGWISSFGGWAEAMKLLILIIVGIYTYSTYVERFKGAQDEKPETEVPPVPTNGQAKNFTHDYVPVSSNGHTDNPANNDRIVIQGFATGIQTPHTTQTDVATKPVFVATNQLEQQIEQIDDKYKRAYVTVLVRDLKAYESKLRTGVGKTTTNEGHIIRLNKEIQKELSNINQTTNSLS